MDVRAAFPSDYLKAADLPKPVKVQMAHVAVEDIGSDQKPVLHFNGSDKGLVLNKINTNIIADMVGSYDSDTWQGKEIVLFKTTTEFQGKMVPCIRVRPPKTQPVAAPAPVAEQPEDDVPF